MPSRNDGIICRECGGSGCDVCNQLGYSKAYYLEHPYREALLGSECEDDTVPMPYGKILPNLTDCYYINEGLSEPEDEDYDEILDEKHLCPNCGSDNVVILDKESNPDVAEEQEILAERFFCISCQDSWCYERER